MLWRYLLLKHNAKGYSREAYIKLREADEYGVDLPEIPADVMSISKDKFIGKGFKLYDSEEDLDSLNCKSTGKCVDTAKDKLVFGCDPQANANTNKRKPMR